MKTILILFALTIGMMACKKNDDQPAKPHIYKYRYEITGAWNKPQYMAIEGWHGSPQKDVRVSYFGYDKNMISNGCAHYTGNTKLPITFETDSASQINIPQEAACNMNDSEYFNIKFYIDGVLKNGIGAGKIILEDNHGISLNGGY